MRKHHLDAFASRRLPSSHQHAPAATSQRAGARSAEKRFPANMPGMRKPSKGSIDPRVYQAAVQASLLLYAMLVLGFDVAPSRLALLLTVSIATQFVCTKLFRLPQFDPKSAINTGLSLCLLFRCGDLPFAEIGRAHV